MKKLLTVILLVTLSGCAEKPDDNYEMTPEMSLTETTILMRKAAIAIDKDDVLALERSLDVVAKTAYEIPCEEVEKSLIKLYGEEKRFLAETGLEPTEDKLEVKNTKNLPRKAYLGSMYFLRLMNLISSQYEVQYPDRCDLDDYIRVFAYFE